MVFHVRTVGTEGIGPVCYEVPRALGFRKDVIRFGCRRDSQAIAVPGADGWPTREPLVRRIRKDAGNPVCHGPGHGHPNSGSVRHISGAREPGASRVAARDRRPQGRGSGGHPRGGGFEATQAPALGYGASRIVVRTHLRRGARTGGRENPGCCKTAAHGSDRAGGPAGKRFCNASERWHGPQGRVASELPSPYGSWLSMTVRR